MARTLPRASAGNQRRTHRSKHRYDKDYRRADWDVDPNRRVRIMPTLDRKNSSSSTPQAPKGGKGRPAPSVPNPKRPTK